MKDFKKNLIPLITIVIVLILLTLGGYYYSTLKKEPKKNTSVNKELEIETGKLKTLNQRHQAEKEVVDKIQQQYDTLKNSVVRNTDIFFSNPNSINPKIKLKIKDKNLEKEINKKRLEITKIFENWDKKMEILNSSSIYENNSERLSSIIIEVQSNVAFIQDYLSKLKSILNNIDPADSEISDIKIESYKEIIDNSIEEVKSVVTTVQAIQVSIPLIYTDAPQTQTTSPSQTIKPTPPMVTPLQIKAQEETVQELIQNTQTQNQSTSTAQNQGEVYVYYPVQYQYNVGSQTIIEYLQSLPAPKIDRSGWPDTINDTNSPIINGGN